MTLFSLKTVNQLQSNATKPVLLKSSRSKLALVLVAGSIIFVVVTFNMNWGRVNAEKSVEDLRLLVKKATSNKEAALKYCPLLIKKLEKSLNNLNGAESTIQKLKATDSLAECHLAMDDYKNAVASLSVLSNAEPQVAKWHQLKAKALFKTHQYDAAMHESRLAIQLQPNHFEINLQDARFARQLGLNARANKAYENAISHAPIDTNKMLRQEYFDYLNASALKHN